mgnify:CR=1 FL=1
MPGSYLESVIVGACPGFADEWAALRRAYPSGVEPDVDDFFAALRAHVEGQLAEGRVTETVRLFYAVERLLRGADPILEELLEERFLVPLAAASRALGLDARLVLPHLGARSRPAWERGWGG